MLFTRIVSVAGLGAYLFASASCSTHSPLDRPDDLPEDDLVDTCAPIFSQDLLPEYRIEISGEHLAQLEDEFLNRAEREEDGLDHNPYHPITFHYDGEVIDDAMIRLKGQSSWWEAITYDDNPKMQFVISFNEIDPDGRFQGMRKIELDMPRSDASFMRQRLALYALRSLGLEAQCANNARLVINGEYYGLFTNLERLDKEFLQRHFGDLDEGNLWKGGREIETNEESFSWERLSAFWDATTIEEVERLVDLEASIREWSAEAVIPHGDGYYNGRANYFLYDHPTRGFVWLAHDLDAAYDYLPADESPMFPDCTGRNAHDRQHYAIVMADDDWRQFYVESLRSVLSEYDPRQMEARVWDWSAQIADSAAEDPMKPFSNAQHDLAVQTLKDYPARRAEEVALWLDCLESGGPDSDGDGFEYCRDCDDFDSNAFPGNAEICNGIDDNCDARIDEPAGGMTCE